MPENITESEVLKGLKYHLGINNLEAQVSDIREMLSKEPTPDPEPITEPDPTPDPDPDPTPEVPPSTGTTLKNQIFEYTFDRDVKYRRSPTGEIMVSLEDGPVTLVSRTPATKDLSGRLVNGAELNPVPGNKQGFDSGAREDYTPYVASKTVKLPLKVTVPTSYVASYTETRKVADRPQLEAADVLSFVDKLEPEGTLRPPYVNPIKWGRVNVNDLDMDKLPSLPLPSNAPNIDTVINYFKLPWIDHGASWIGRFLHPAQNLPDYGRDIALRIGEAACVLCLDYPRDKKRKLLACLLEYALDLKQIAIDSGKGGNHWLVGGGHAQGRKFPLVLLAYMTGDEDAKRIAQEPNTFVEDAQCFYVSMEDVDRILKPDARDGHVVPYRHDLTSDGKVITSDLGMPEWGIWYWLKPGQSNAYWDTIYRACCTANSWLGYLAAVAYMGIQDLWGPTACFDYAARYVFTEERLQQVNSTRPAWFLTFGGKQFMVDMFKKAPIDRKVALAHTDRTFQEKRIFPNIKFQTS